MKQKIKYIIFAVLLGLIIGFLYNHIVILDSYRKEFSSYKHSVKEKNSNYVEMCFPVLHKETHSLKITSPENIEKKIVVNRNILIPWKTKFHSKKHSKPVDYILIPPEKLNIGKNYLKIYLPSKISDRITMRLENYRGKTGERIIVLFQDSHILPLQGSFITYLYSILIVLSLSLFLAWILKILLIKRTVITTEYIYSRIFISFLPANILLLLAGIIPITMSLRLFITSSYFWMLQAVALGLTYCMFFCNYNKKMIAKIIKIVVYHLRWGTNMFFFIFVCNLFCCGFYLYISKKAEPIIDISACNAFYFLILFVISKSIVLLRNEKTEIGKDRGKG